MDHVSAWDELLEKKEYARAAALVLQNTAPLFAGTVGLDGRPQVRPAWFAFEQDGALYFLTRKSSRMYAELSKKPYVQFCCADRDTQTTVRLSGKVCFTEEQELLDRAAAACPAVLRHANGEKKQLIAFFLLGAEILAERDGPEPGEQRLVLPDPAGVRIGITIRKKTELRDRLSRILERREAAPPDRDTIPLYDGALFVFAEAAKALWPRMDIMPLERAACYETYDERERYTAMAAALIGNAVIDDPEDMTYWLDPARWANGTFRP